MPDAWIVPKNGQSVLFVRLEAMHYRDAVRPLVEKGPVAMPERSIHWLDVTRELLVYAEDGNLHLLRGLSETPPSEVVQVPGAPRIHALEVVDDVVFVGADAGQGMFGFWDLRASAKWQQIPLPSQVNWAGKGIDGFAVHGSRLIAIDDVVIPRYLLVVDISNPREPRWIEHRDYPAHSSCERVASVTSNGEIVVMLSHSVNHGATASHIGFMNLVTLEEYAVLSVQGLSSFRKWADRSYDFHAIALQGRRLLIAAGADGLALLPVRHVPKEKNRPKPARRNVFPQIPRLSVETLRFVPVPQGSVVGVVPIDETHAFAIVERPLEGLLPSKTIESVLVSLPARLED
ncbi:MAG TPA: hypothetical protein PK156_15870 [Polyangium sp.]|nr:hypothetical protein [Polyangium sp.]